MKPKVKTKRSYFRRRKGFKKKALPPAGTRMLNKRSMYKANLTKITNLTSIAPERLNVKLNWSHTSFFDGSGIPSVTKSNVYRLNSPYDPNYSSVAVGEPNKSCIGFNTLANLYSKYIVHGVTIYTKALNYSRSDIMINVAAYKRDGAEPTTHQLAERQQYSKTRLISAIGAGTNNNAFIKTYVSIPELLGMTRQQYYNNDDTISHVSDNPNQIARLIFQYFVIRGPTESGAITHGLTFSHQFIYNITFSERRKLTTDE